MVTDTKTSNQAMERTLALTHPFSRSANPMITTSTAASDSHFEQILSLQRRNLGRALSQEQQRSEGFVFAEHSIPLLRRMAAELPQAIALSGDQVVGYCLALPPSLRAELPSLEPMFVQFARCIYKGRPLPEYRFVVGGQVCVDRPFRGQDLLKRLYHEIRVSLPSHYDLCVTEIAVRNQVSIRAHEKMGFHTLNTYSDEREQWAIVAWDLREPT
jgi:hypothetical protein